MNDIKDRLLWRADNVEDGFHSDMIYRDALRCIEALDKRIEALEAALLEIFDHECRTSDRSFIACTARDALWPRAALGEKKDE